MLWLRATILLFSLLSCCISLLFCFPFPAFFWVIWVFYRIQFIYCDFHHIFLCNFLRAPKGVANIYFFSLSRTNILPLQLIITHLCYSCLYIHKLKIPSENVIFALYYIYSYIYYFYSSFFISDILFGIFSFDISFLSEELPLVILLEQVCWLWVLFTWECLYFSYILQGYFHLI